MTEDEDRSTRYIRVLPPCKATIIDNTHLEWIGNMISNVYYAIGYDWYGHIPRMPLLARW